MKTRIIESPIIFLSVIKWFTLAVCIGGIVGGATTLFLKTLAWGISITHQFPYYFWLLPLALPLSSILIDSLAPEAEGYGARVIEAIHKYSGKIPPLVPPIKFLASIITIIFGGSAGKTGPCAQVGAGLASIFASLLKLSDMDRKKLVICGLSAAFSTIFNASIAGAIFGSEVLYVGALFYDFLFPSFIAGIVASRIAVHFGISYPLYLLPRYSFHGFSGIFFGKVFGSGIFFGLCSLLLIHGLSIGQKICRAIPIRNPLKGILGGAALIALTYLFSEQYLGLGVETIDFCLLGHPVAAEAFLLKMLFVSITLNFCGSGGIITPILFIGAAFGNLFGQLSGSELALFSAIGMVSLLAGAANIPLTATIMAAELFGPQIAPYAAVACITSFLMAGHHSVYPSQVMFFAKSGALGIDTQKEIREINDIRITTQRPGLIGMIVEFLQNQKKQ